MRFTSIFLAALLAGVSGAALAADAEPKLPTSPKQWRAAALRDVEAGYRVTLANHAGAHDPHNPAFLTNLRAAKAHGAALAAQVSDGSGYIAALLGFSNRIHDGHAGVYPSFDAAAVRPAQWPGFVAAWRGDLFVYASEDGAAREGERIVSCDGKPARTLLEQNVFAFLGRIKEDGQWWSQTRNLFIDTGNPFVARPKRCVFELDGRQVERSLAWREAPKSLAPLLRESVAGDALPVGLSEPRKNLFWVAMPTFQPSDEERAAYRAIYEQVRSQRARFLGADAVVVDLRRNQGGSSDWSQQFAKALWGDAELKRRDDARNAGVEVWYRASPGNIAYYQRTREDDLARGETASAQWWAEREAAMRKALAAKSPYAIRKDEEEATEAAPQPAPAPFTRPVYVIVPGNCASACLDAIDYFKLFPNTKLVGAPSSADSTYMEVRIEPLPGGLGRVVVPTKLYVNRPRGNGEFYRPDIPVTSLRWTTATFLEVVERDLAGK
ncbi:S41 family peptidase [Massilia sp. 9I]|uniref:S41 family peptidase n=1 Tax=Massilia sp. 9I TaxID=2653152 RepID=UPI0012EF99FA|nr:S41 family peptidase [Massilia sp. 9I]VXC77895.1 conserved exported hypothetical protein [Massilia sp. 9I]